MEIGFLKKQIKERAVEQFYIFTGNEVKAQDIYIDKMADVMGRVVQRVDSVASIMTRKTGLLAKPILFVVRDDKEFIKAEKSWDSAIEQLGKNALVFLLTEADKRTKFYKHFSDRLVVFDYMSTESLTRYIKKQLPLNDYCCHSLIDVCEHDYSRILLELDKIKAYDNKDVNGACIQLLNDGTIHIPPKDAIFDYCDAMLQAKMLKSFELLEECKKIGEPSLRLIQVLYTNARKLLQVQACERGADICKVTGLSQWDVKCVSDKLNKWSTEDLVYFLRLLQSVEKRIKTGEMDDSIAMDYIMVKLF